MLNLPVGNLSKSKPEYFLTWHGIHPEPYLLCSLACIFWVLSSRNILGPVNQKHKFQRLNVCRQFSVIPYALVLLNLQSHGVLSVMVLNLLILKWIFLVQAGKHLSHFLLKKSFLLMTFTFQFKPPVQLCCLLLNSCQVTP